MSNTKLKLRPVSYYKSLLERLLLNFRQNHKLSQIEISRALNYKFNQWHKWESGQKILRWHELVQICSHFGIPLQAGLETILDQRIADIQDGAGVFKKVIEHFGRLQTRHQELSISRSKLRRILAGEHDFEVHLLFKIIGDFSSMLPYFVELLSPAVSVESLQADRFKKQMALEAEYPWLCAIEALLMHKDYKKLKMHSDSLFVERLGIPLKEVQKSFQRLKNIGAIEFINKKYVLRILRVDMNVDIQHSAKLAKFWSQVCVERFATVDAVPRGRGWSYRIFPVSSVAQAKIREKLNRLTSDIYDILLQDEAQEKDHVQVLVTHFFDHTEFSQLSSVKGIKSPVDK